MKVRPLLLKGKAFPIPSEIKNPKVIPLIEMATAWDEKNRCTALELKAATEKVIESL